MTSLLLFGLMGKYELKGDMPKGFRVLQLAVNDRNFQEGLLTALPRSGLLEPSVRADGRDRAAFGTPVTLLLGCCPTRSDNLVH